MLLVKAPVPEPLVVFEPEVVGTGDVLQHTPRAVTLNPPSLVMVPPQVAVVVKISVTEEVDSVA